MPALAYAVSPDRFVIYYNSILILLSSLNRSPLQAVAKGYGLKSGKVDMPE